jgi:dTDP-4-dehydrorhamnose reductase
VKILITGANGQLGLALARRLGEHASGHAVTSHDRSSLDIANADACLRAVEQSQCDVVLNCAAYTAVDRAESERDAAFAANAIGPGNLAAACRRFDAFLVHFSTDYVFDGRGNRPYVETDATSPLGVYGESKLAGEAAVRSTYDAHAILRLSWVYSNDGANFYKTMLRLGAERDQLRVVADQFGTPNYTGELADAVAHMLSHSRAALREKSGLYHLSASGVTTWHQFAREIFTNAQLSRSPSVEPITTADYPTPAKRPAFSALDGSRFATTFGWEIKTWQQGLNRCLAERSQSA